MAARPADASTAPWASLPRELLGLCFCLLAEVVEVEASAAEQGLGLAQAAALLASLSPCREWRDVALETLCLRLRLDSARQLRSPHLRLLRCRELRLPGLPEGLPPAARADAELAATRLLVGRPFRQRSGGCPQALLGVPLPVAAAGVLESAAFPRLRHLALADCPPFVPTFTAAQALRSSCFPAGLRSLQLPSRLLGAGLSEQLPRELRHLVQHSELDAAVGCPSLGVCCTELTVLAGRTATLLLDALATARACQSLAVQARWVVLSSPDPAHCAALRRAAGGSPAAVAAAAALYPLLPHAEEAPGEVQAARQALEMQLVAWLAVLALDLAPSCLCYIAFQLSELSLYCRSTGRMASLHLGRWREPGVVVQVAAHGLEARLRWPVPGRPPAFFSLVVRRQEA